MRSLKQSLEDAQSNGIAIGHFNVADLVFLKAVAAAARELRVPVIVGASEGERKFLGTRQLAALVHSLRDEWEVPIFLNGDHTHSLPSAEEAARAGYDSIVFDLSALPFDENVRQTRQAVQTLKRINHSILVEGEIGDIGTGSEIHAEAPNLSAGLTDPDQAHSFVEATGVDILAPAVGNMHGMVRSMVQGQTRKRLDLDRIRQIKNAAGVYMTLHGGSGTNDEDLREAIVAGINIVHINTELRLAWRTALDESLAKEPEQVVPYKVLPAVEESIKQVAASRLRLFNAVRSAAN
jgi:fructose-bisphosphate aldolase, class II